MGKNKMQGSSKPLGFWGWALGGGLWWGSGMPGCNQGMTAVAIMSVGAWLLTKADNQGNTSAEWFGTALILVGAGTLLWGYFKYRRSA